MATQTGQPDYGPKNGPIGKWTDRVRFSAAGHAYRPAEVLCAGAEVRDAAAALLGEVTDRDPQVEEVIEGHWRVSSTQDFDVETLVARLRDQALAVNPNNVVFAHGAALPGGCSCDCSCGPSAGPAGANPYYANPYYANAVQANPYYANAVHASPYYANQMGANPYYANPYYANPYYANPYYANYQTSGERPSTARPAVDPTADLPTLTLTKNRARAFILDTGLAADLPPFLDRAPMNTTNDPDRDHPDESGDNFLDPASGHGSFIAGILEQLAPNQDVHLCRVLSTFGDGDVAAIAERVDELRTTRRLNPQTIINMSFGGYADNDTPILAQAIRLAQDEGAVVVASAGNDGSCHPMYPAALPGVIAVGSIEPHGRAHYSNFGPWVRACAPGTALTSAFFRDYNGSAPQVTAPSGLIDPDHFLEWAQWTGTSFAAPVVAAALMRHMALTRGTAAQAVEFVIDAPGLLRHPGLGTVVNLLPGM